MRRNRLIYCVMMFFYISSRATAQDGPLPAEELIIPKLKIPPGAAISLKIGTNIYTPIITDNPEEVYSTSPTAELSPGLNAGIGVEVELTNKISLFADFQYIQSSARYLIRSGDFTDEFIEDFKQISLPFGLLYNLGSGGIKYYPLAGICLDYLIKSKLDYAYHPYPEESGYTDYGETDITFDRNRLHLDMQIGFGFQYQVKRVFLGLEIAYRHGLINYIDTDQMQPMQIYYHTSPPFEFQSPGFRTHGIMVNLIIKKKGK